jgi:hypothetical protein
MNSKELENNITDLSTCEICSEFIGELIFQCPSGHYMCKNCITRLEICPTCRINLPRTGIRNRCLENILTMLPSIQCKEDGCNTRVKFTDMNDHYSRCEQRTVKCPIYSCKWNGKVINVKDHIEKDHSEGIVNIESDINILLNNPTGYGIDAYSQTIARSRSNKIFIIGFWVVKGADVPSSIIGTIHHVGVNTRNIRGAMCVNCESNDYKLTCQRIPWNILDNLVDSVKSKHNLYINWNFALLNGKTGPVFRVHDQLHKSPLPIGLNLSIDIIIKDQDPDINTCDIQTNPVITASMISLVDDDF